MPGAIDEFLTAVVEDDADALLADIASEARLACRLLSTLEPTREMRLLEVGAGAGVVAAFLQQQGAELVAIEPAVGGFEHHARVRALLAKRVPVPTIEPIAAEQLDPDVHGRFAVIFSVNVLEHMQPLQRNLDALAAVLAPGGQMIHTCPNYRVPYEPHYGIPLVPGRPALTRLIARRASRESAWKSLNWISAGDIERFAHRHGLELQFTPGQLAASLDRFRQDEAFARRQQGPIVGALRYLDALGVGRLLARVPPAWMTPMTFVARSPAARRGAASPASD